MATHPFTHIQRNPPFGRLTPQRICLLPFDRLHPVIRIAHRVVSSLQVAERIIFDYELVWIVNGAGTLWFGDERQEFETHDLFCIPPFVPHRLACTSGPETIHLAVHFDFAPGLPPDRWGLDRRLPYAIRLPRGCHLPRQIRLVGHDRVAEDLDQLVAAWTRGDDLGQLEARACLTRVLVAIMRRTRASVPQAGAARDRLRIEQALALLAHDPARHWRPAELARTVELSPSHFNRLFHEWTGFAPAEYQRRQRIAQARALLADVALSVKEIASRVGFDDPYHFSRVFRQVDGLAPTQYREAVLAGRGKRDPK